MKKAALWVLLCSIAACQPDDEEVMYPINRYCTFKTDISAPQGFVISRIDSIDLDGALDELQMIDQQQGYLLGHSNFGGYVRVFKTVNGGQTWNDLLVNEEVKPINLFFLNAEVGIVSYYGNNGDILKTTDGGANWEPLSFPELNGNMYHIQQDSEGKLYAMLKGLDTKAVIIKSTDQGQSWQTLYSEALDFRLVTFSFRIKGKRIFVSGEGGTLVTIDLNGNLIKTIATEQSYFWDVEVIDENNIVVVADQTIKTTDGGESWRVIYDGSARMVDFTTSKTGIMLLNKSYCPSDVYQANDVVAVTRDGGVTWTESEESTNLMASMVGGQRMSDGRYLLAIGNEVLELHEN